MKAIRKLDTDLKGVAAALNITVPHARKLWLEGAFPGYRLGHRTRQKTRAAPGPCAQRWPPTDLDAPGRMFNATIAELLGADPDLFFLGQFVDNWASHREVVVWRKGAEI
jgi:hypothetical protein